MINKRTGLSILQLVVTLCNLALSLSLVHADITLTVGDGSGSPGSSENPVIVSLDNSVNKVKGLQVDVCDVDGYLLCTACGTTGRTTGFDCMINKLDGGCCRVILANLTAGIIEEGTGSIFTVKYTISSSAPGGECVDLTPEEVQIADENGDPFPPDDVVLEPGEFCFVSSTTTTSVREFPCLISKIYGENSEEIEFLRNFRDHLLSKTPGGRELIGLYYRLGPAIVKVMEGDEAFREEVKKIIDATLALIEVEAE
jgi:hypothetical protein